MHILVVHAMIILLTYGEPQLEPSQTSRFQALLQVWFPSNGEPPQAFLVETSEEALLYPDWLKLRMIRSNVEALVDGSLKDLEPGQLILFIQSFGIPVASISKLLQALDRMVQANPFAFVEVDMDKVYMQQLLQVQAQRGARGGHHFADIMQLNEPEPTAPRAESNVDQEDVKDPHLVRSVTMNLNARNAGPTVPAILQAEHVASTLLKLFDAGTVLRFSHQEKAEAYRMLNRRLAAEVGAATRPSIEATATALDHLLNSPSVSSAESATLLSTMERQPAFSCGLTRLLTLAASAATAPSSLVATVQRICLKILDCRESSSRSPLRSIAQSFITRRATSANAAASSGRSI